MSLANGERRVAGLDSPLNHSPTRRKLKEVALRRWCRWVLVSPTYLDLRTPQVRTARETVPSTPALAAYRRAKSGAFS
jgi:hypothetical protein